MTLCLRNVCERIAKASAGCRTLLLVIAGLALSGCGAQPELKPVEHVDLERFMGRWYVIASIPTFLEKGAHNAVESYALNGDGTIDTTFTFLEESFEGEVKEMNPKGFVREGTSNAVWGMQFIWPFKADYRVVYLDEDYSQTIIGRNKRDYVWLMARSPSIPDADYRGLVQLIESMGYDTRDLQEVPQSW